MVESWSINSQHVETSFTDKGKKADRVFSGGLFNREYEPTHIVYDGDDEVYRGGYTQVLDWIRNQREKLFGSQIHIAPIQIEMDVPVKSERASDFVIFEGDDEEETGQKS